MGPKVLYQPRNYIIIIVLLTMTLSAIIWKSSEIQVIKKPAETVFEPPHPEKNNSHLVATSENQLERADLLYNLCVNAREQMIMNSINIKSGINLLFSQTGLILAIPPITQVLEPGIEYHVPIYQCSPMYHETYTIADLTLRGRLIGPVIHLLNISQVELHERKYLSAFDYPRESFTFSFMATEPGSYKIEISVLFLGESTWKFEFMDTSPHPEFNGYFYYGNLGRITTHDSPNIDSSQIYGSANQFLNFTGISMVTKDSKNSFLPFCESLGNIIYIIFS